MVREKQPRRGTPGVMTWTRFNIPDLISDEYQSEWDQYLQLLGKTYGYIRSTIGKIAESPNEVLLISVWSLLDDAEAFTASPGYCAYIEFLRRNSRTPLQQITVDPAIPFLFLHGRISIHTFSFPYPAAEEKRQIFGGIRGLYVSYSVGGTMENEPTRGLRPRHLWVREPQVLDGKTVENAVLVHFWKNLEGENKVMGNRDAMKRWKVDLERIDPLYMKEEHCELLNDIRAWTWQSMAICIRDVKPAMS